MSNLKQITFMVPRIQGFPESYILEGTQTDQKKFIGNSVHPKVPKVWILAMSNKLKAAS